MNLSEAKRSIRDICNCKDGMSPEKMNEKIEMVLDNLMKGLFEYKDKNFSDLVNKNKPFEFVSRNGNRVKFVFKDKG